MNHVKYCAEEEAPNLDPHRKLKKDWRQRVKQEHRMEQRQKVEEGQMN
jgi:hypothetical protein